MSGLSECQTEQYFSRDSVIALSREKYCSVWHSLRPDIAFTTSFEVTA